MENSFLRYVAEDLISKFGTKLANVAVVFPNKRASLFLNDHLARLADQPVWSPSYITISDLFRHHSTLEVADSVKLVCDLHRVFTAVTGKDETLDQFFSWGQLLLSDFDDIDKNLADPRRVFANLRDIHELDDTSYLSDEQKQLLAKFFANFQPEKADSQLKQKFLTIWNKLYEIYTSFNARLEEQGLAYEGRLYRQVAELDEIDFQYDTYVFVGFNMLQKVEQKLFERLQRQGRARFYWNFDDYYMKNHHESGHFIRQYLDKFPNELDNKNEKIYNNLAQPKDIAYISAKTDTAQARFVSQWLLEEGKNRIADGRDTAIVLCDENLLQSVVHALPEEVKKVNITTGYPLAQSPFATLVNLLIALQTDGYDTKRKHFRQRYLDRVQRHPYAIYFDFDTFIDSSTKELSTLNSQLSTITGILQHIGTEARDNDDPFFQESLFRTYTLVNRLKTLVENGDLDCDLATFRRLLNQLIQSTTIPFHGEPAEGLQIMGVLETRNLDFKHVLVLSANEGNMPKNVSDSSFIPYSIRKAHDLTTIDHKVAIYAYYFHALLQRATDIALLYNNATEDGNRGEMTRFMLQFMVESPHQNIQKYHLSPNTQNNSTFNTENNSTPNTQHPTPNTENNSTFTISPTDINRYLRCPKLFFYRNIAGIHESNNADADDIDSRVFGNIFHRAAELIYKKIGTNRLLQKSDLEPYTKEPQQIEMAVDQAFEEEFKNILSSKNNSQHPTPNTQQLTLNGLQIINRKVIIDYLKRLLEIDQKLTPFTVIDVETPIRHEFTVHGQPITIKGIIDRLDCINTQHPTTNTQQPTPNTYHPTPNAPQIRVIDYKTGGKTAKTIDSVEEIFDPVNITKKHSDYYLQTLLYATILEENPKLINFPLSGGTEGGSPISPALIFIQHTSGDNYDPTLCFGKEPISDIRQYKNDFKQRLQQLLEEIFDPSQTFPPTDDLDRCKNCPYKKICR